MIRSYFLLGLISNFWNPGLRLFKGFLKAETNFNCFWNRNGLEVCVSGSGCPARQELGLPLSCEAARFLVRGDLDSKVAIGIS